MATPGPGEAETNPEHRPENAPNNPNFSNPPLGKPPPLACDGQCAQRTTFLQIISECGKDVKKCGREMWEKCGCRWFPVTTEALRARIWTRTSGPPIVFHEDSENRSPGADFGGFEVPNHDFSKNAVPHISRIFPALFPHFSRIVPAFFPQFPPACFPHFSRNFRPHFSHIFPASGNPPWAPQLL